MLNPHQKNSLNIKFVFLIFIFDFNNRILMQLRDNKPSIAAPNMWGPIGGHCKKDETPYECCLREAKEETGYLPPKINWHKNIFLSEDKDNNHIAHYLSVFWCNYKYEKEIMCYEGQQIKFKTLEEIKCLNTFQHNIKCIKEILEIKNNEKK